jgi:lipid II:glycine glycyltransferase (peptidoglycan interpeptide bridge formation enzyme)
LKDGFETVFKRWSKGHRSKAKKGIKSGVTVKRATVLEDWQHFYEVYQDTIERWGKKGVKPDFVFEWPLFETMAKRNSPNIKLWLAQYNDHIIGGHLVFYHNYHVTDWLGASRTEYLHLHPNQILKYFIIKNACEKQYSWFDLHPSMGYEGVVKFKKGFAPEIRDIYSYYFKSPLFKKLSKIKYTLCG